MQSLMGADSGKLALLNEQNNMMDMITLRFSESTMYSVGDYALYFNGVFDGLYRFKEAKTTGAWDGSKVEQVSLAGILKQHESAISELNTRTDVPYLGNPKTGDLLKETLNNWLLSMPNGAFRFARVLVDGGLGAMTGGSWWLIAGRVGPPLYGVILAIGYNSGNPIVMSVVQSDEWVITAVPVTLKF